MGRENVPVRKVPGFFACNPAEESVVGRPSAFYKLRDDRPVPVICPTCQNVFAGSLKASMPATPCYFAWGCFRYFSLGRAPRPANEKSPALRRGLPCSRLVQVRTSDLAADWDSGPDDSGPAAAGPASGRRPAAGRASGPGSGSAGPGSGSGCSFGISVVERNGETTGKAGVGFAGTPVPPGSLRGISLSRLRLRNPGSKTSPVQAP